MMVVVIMVMMMCTDSIIPSRIYIHLAEKQITAIRLTRGGQEKEEFGVFSSLSLSLSFSACILSYASNFVPCSSKQ